MRILISNDDGVYAPGIRVLADHLSDIALITVVAPDRDRSGASNSLTLDNPLRALKLDNGFYLVQGTPTDCVHLAITGLLPEMPDMVLAGINDGANLGDDILYSGTVAAAMEGRFMGFSAIAVSLVGRGEGAEKHYTTAASIIKKIVKKIQIMPLPTNIILNINVPNMPLTDIQGFEITRLGSRHRAEDCVPDIDPRGHPIYWIGPAGLEQDAGIGTDFYAISQNKVSITPLLLDLTSYTSFQDLSGWVTTLNESCSS